MKKDTIMVTFLPDRPERNHTVGKNYKYADEMAGFVCGVLLLVTTLILLLVFIKSLIFGYTPYQPRQGQMGAPAQSAH